MNIINRFPLKITKYFSVHAVPTGTEFYQLSPC